MADKKWSALLFSRRVILSRLRESQIQKIPYTLVIGDNEMNTKSVTYRKYGTKEQITVSLDEFISMILKEIKEKKPLNA